MQKTILKPWRLSIVVIFIAVGVLLSGLLFQAHLLLQNRQQIAVLIGTQLQKSRLVTHLQSLARQRTQILHQLLRAEDDNVLQTSWQTLNNIDSAYLNIRQALRGETLNAEQEGQFDKHDALLQNHVAHHAQIAQSISTQDYRTARDILFNTIIPDQEMIIEFIERVASSQLQSTTNDIDAARRVMSSLVIYLIVNVFLMLGVLAIIGTLMFKRQRRDETAKAFDRRSSFTAFSSIHEAVIVSDKHGNVEHLNQAAEALLGVTQQDAAGISLDSLLAISTAKGPRQNLVAGVLATGKTLQLDEASCLLLRHKKEVAVQLTISPIPDSRHGVSGTVVILRDMTELSALTSELARQTMQDSLTGLLNRREFENRLEQTITEIRRYPAEQAWFCYLDMDQFKIINDTCGHLAGDELLKQVAHKLVTITREVDHIGRVGSDEFSIILKRCKQDMALQIMERVRKEIHDMRFCWDNKCFAVTVSIGIVEINDKVNTVYDVLKAADTACHLAKEDGRNRIHKYDHNDQQSSKHQGEMEWVHRIYHAIETGQFVLYFQEIKSLKPEGDGIHGELLVRMLDDDGNIIPPYAFIPAAERYNIMQEVDRHIVHLALSSISKHYANPLVHNGLFAINLSAQSLSDDSFLEFVLTQLASAKVRPGNICFEITETAAISNLVRATKFIKTLKEKGCYFALDDFGSGLSSFAYLKNLPVDYIKIDGGFVKGMLSNSLDYTLVSAVNQIGHVVGMSTIAEFVETLDIEDILTSMGVDYGQGYGIARPEPFEALLSKLAADSRKLKTQ